MDLLVVLSTWETGNNPPPLISMQYNIQNPQYISMFCVKVCEEEKKTKKEEISMRLEDGELGTRNWNDPH